MKFFITSVATLLCLNSWAVQFDPILQPYLGRSNDNRIVRTVVTFKSSVDFSRVGSVQIRAPQARAQMQMMMMQNAQRSQAQFMQTLGQWKRGGMPTQSYSLWLINGMIVDLPVKELSKLGTVDSIDYVYADSVVKLIAPVEGRWVAPSQMRDEPQFTYGLQKIAIPEFRKAKPDALGQGVRVGVIDTGIDASHPDLQGKVVAFADLVSKKTEPYDDQGHGTHVSGTIAGGTASGTAIGVAPQVKFITAKFLDKNGSGSFSNAVLAMQWVVDPDGKPETDDGAMLVSNSWGGGSPSAKEDPKDNAMCKAVDAWVKLGVMPVFAAGNSGPGAKTVGLPGGCPNAFTIGATDSQDQIANFSSRGPAIWKTGSFVKPDVLAPGVKVKSSMPGNKYAELSGTSMATPHAAGVVSLMYQLQPKLTVEQLSNALKSTAAKVGQDPNTYGSGRIDTLKAAQALGLFRARF
ncbi:MAG: S8 family serine peptidase [Bdellovibrionaceae bacterium]|nr:S8 family serine peptidase [Pseudobdellovibrionaceae bacterium]NUM58884.1 S8 family serine peptidase [Pseudobdellovibrionaceae bacterium]